MKAVAMFIVMVGNAFKMQEFVLLLIFMRHKRTKACKSPDGQVKFPHPWPPQIPPGRTGQIMTTRG